MTKNILFIFTLLCSLLVQNAFANNKPYQIKITVNNTSPFQLTALQSANFASGSYAKIKPNSTESFVFSGNSPNNLVLSYSTINPNDVLHAGPIILIGVQEIFGVACRGNSYSNRYGKIDAPCTLQGSSATKIFDVQYTISGSTKNN